MKRRTFLKVAGLSGLSIAAGCGSEPEKTLYSLVQAPDDMVTGSARWYASTCRECPAGCGVLAKNREGRVIKLEGNPGHPINRGALCMRGQAALQGVYNPDRVTRPRLKEKGRWRDISFEQALELVRRRARRAGQAGAGRVRMISETVGESLLGLFTRTLGRYNSRGPLVFEPYAYEASKAANRLVFGIAGLPAVHMDRSDLVLGFGADFLETWLSPVEYARQFKAMHSPRSAERGAFWHVGPYQSLTAANADAWVACHPAGETAVALGLIRQALQRGRGEKLPAAERSALARLTEPFDRPRAAELAGISEPVFTKLAERLLAAARPLVLGTGAGDAGGNSLQTNLAAGLLNYLLDPSLARLDFSGRHRVEIAATRAEVLAEFESLRAEPVELLLLYNSNPLFNLPPGSGVAEALGKEDLFVVAFTAFMDETAEQSDLVFPTGMPLEVWDEYAGRRGMVSTLQPAMGRLTDAPDIGDVFLALQADPTGGPGGEPPAGYRRYLYDELQRRGACASRADWLQIVRYGGRFDQTQPEQSPAVNVAEAVGTLEALDPPVSAETVLIAAPSVRFFDGRGANRPWLCEIPEPVSKIAWQTPLFVHPDRLADLGAEQGEVLEVTSPWGGLRAPAYESAGVRPNVVVMPIGQGHTAYGRYARGQGLAPGTLLPPETAGGAGAPSLTARPVQLAAMGSSQKLAHTDGSRIQHGRKIALSVETHHIAAGADHGAGGLSMHDFPLTLPLPEGYDSGRDFYAPLQYKDYRWAMVVDLDRCIGCGACAAACYAENNIGIVGEAQVLQGREMSWLRIDRYHDPQHPERIIFLPMMCQHCDNAPCESVCPVYAPHHNAEGMNNQIYNRCIGTRFCAQNCPYKVRRFNWFSWQWPEPMHYQLNPDVTVRSKGVMEKCSFCVQRIKEAHGVAKNEERPIADGEVVPACVQTCPTGALVFGNLLDPASRVRRLADDVRAYQVMGYLNTKPAVIYLKKVRQEI